MRTSGATDICLGAWEKYCHTRMWTFLFAMRMRGQGVFLCVRNPSAGLNPKINPHRWRSCGDACIQAALWWCAERDSSRLCHARMPLPVALPGRLGVHRGKPCSADCFSFAASVSAHPWLPSLSKNVSLASKNVQLANGQLGNNERAHLRFFRIQIRARC